jgi:ABC-2 type transport system ATP-binding protein
MINIRHLDFGYRKALLFRDLNLEIKPGCIYGLLGKNGAGKTTLLKLLTGLRRPGAGNIEVLSHLPSRREASFLADIYIVPEDIHLPNLTANGYERAYAVFYPRFSSNLFDQYLEDLEIEPDIRSKNLSYGQQKKLLLAFGLAANTPLVLLDEPTNGLDIPSKSKFRKILASALTEDRTIIISTHQARDLENLIDPVIILDSGQIIFQQEMATITQKLAVRLVHEEPRGNQCIYYEKIMGGYCIVTENKDDMETRVDLEVLFNTVINQTDRILPLFESAHTRSVS